MPMPRGERAARVARAKRLGRAAYRLARDGKIIGNVELEGEEKRLTEFTRGQLAIELARPFRASAADWEWSKLWVRWDATRVLELRWDRVGSFKVVQISEGEWQDALVRQAG